MIQLDSVTKFYGERLIFRDVSFKVVEGEKVGIVGKNGAETLVPIQLDEKETDALIKSAETLKTVINEAFNDEN